MPPDDDQRGEVRRFTDRFVTAMHTAQHREIFLKALTQTGTPWATRPSKTPPPAGTTKTIGSGPREREAFMFAEGRELLWWYIEEVRGLFPDDALDPYAPLFPSERLPSALGAEVAVAPPVCADTFRRSLRAASLAHLKGTVTVLFPHLLRHACATHNYEAGMPLWDVQVLLGHTWPTTTVGYLASAKADPEPGSRRGSGRSARARVRAAASGRCRSRAAARAPCGACRRTEPGGTREQSRLVRPVCGLGRHHGFRPVLRVSQRLLPEG
ncbi:site-specific integrase [Streptomyces afghaniensis]|uniref:site-specific integrase n=1 Tax=Streptomyces afghaniensis TaxID=66865 RepID=UPI0037B4BDC3